MYSPEIIFFFNYLRMSEFLSASHYPGITQPLGVIGPVGLLLSPPPTPVYLVSIISPPLSILAPNSALAKYKLCN